MAEETKDFFEKNLGIKLSSNSGEREIQIEAFKQLLRFDGKLKSEKLTDPANKVYIIGAFYDMIIRIAESKKLIRFPEPHSMGITLKGQKFLKFIEENSK